MSDSLGLQIIWPDVFIDPDFSYDKNDHRRKRHALADGLCGWANCMMGKDIAGKIPEAFGVGMVRVGDVLDEIPTADNLMKVAEEYGNRTRTL